MFPLQVYSPTNIMLGAELDGMLVAVYFGVLVVLAVYGLHRYFLVCLHYRHSREGPEPLAHFESLPSLTVQLPLYNEKYVVDRLIDSVCNLDYPRDRLEIQVLDDSDDETQKLARRLVARYQKLGFNIRYLRRDNRVGFKAGALAYGLESAKGEYIAIFDADFNPRPETLEQVIHFFTDPSIGMVQMRWTHRNRNDSLLTKIQSILLDGHFVLESSTRYRSGRFFNFNGTAGVWRRQSIEEAGGWQHDTLTEDLDLSYRAQMRGWCFVFLSDVCVAGELPAEINSFKSQQYRWAKGSIQTAKKILPDLLASELPLKIKIEAWFHLTANIAYPLMVLLSLLMLPTIVVRYGHGWLDLLLLDLPLFMAATGSVLSFYVVSQKEVGPDWRSQIKYLPALMCIGIGISISNARAVLEALVGIESAFVRTPKFGLGPGFTNWPARSYRAKVGFVSLLELSLGFYFLLALWYSLSAQVYGIVPFVCLFLFGFLYTGGLSLFQSLFPLRRVSE